ncbi:MAG: chemotaxis protein CheW [Cyanothece sp. SIO1E1]|nr:chemotaxis protein CheW [Cyanothece sp. SIO1E1]
MANALNPLKFDNFARPDLNQSVTVLKLIVFSLGNLNLAVRIESVHKIVQTASVHGSGLNHVGIAHVEGHEITVIELHKRFLKSSSAHPTNSEGYLIIVWNTAGEHFGIPVTQDPIMMEVPLSMIRALPESYRRADTLKFASHVAVVPQSPEPLTLFLLDVDLLLPTFLET